jgi:hypothetical protein
VATIESPVRRKRVVWIVAGALVLIGVVLVILALRSPPQMGADKEVFRTVDALFTAVTGRDERQLDQCERRLHQYRDAGTLPGAAAAYLDDVMRRARAGDWQVAAERLYDFMRGQRRDGVGERDVARNEKARPSTNAVKRR